MQCIYLLLLICSVYIIILVIANMQCIYIVIIAGVSLNIIITCHLSEPPPEILAQIRERKRKESELEKQKVILHSSVIKKLF